MGEQHRVHIAPRHTGSQQPLAHAGSAIDQHDLVIVANNLDGSVADGIDSRTAGAEQGDVHGNPGVASPPVIVL